MERVRRLRRASPRGVARLFQASVRPALIHGSEVHGLSPNENRRVERIATAALAPASGGVSRTAKIDLARGALAPRAHRGHAPALLGAMGFNARWRCGPACVQTCFAVDGVGGRTPIQRRMERCGGPNPHCGPGSTARWIRCYSRLCPATRRSHPPAHPRFGCAIMLPSAYGNTAHSPGDFG